MKKEWLEKLGKGGIGCAMSHISVMHEIKKQNEQYGLIFEDDVVITNPNKNPNVLTYGLWSLKNVGTSNVQVPTPDPNFDRDQLAYQASAAGMSREEWIAHYGSASTGDGSGTAG